MEKKNAPPRVQDGKGAGKKGNEGIIAEMDMEIKYNTKFKRWEVYGPRSVIRAGERQPVFVAERWGDCSNYIARAGVFGCES